MQTYLFYDLETTGLNKAFDQILHFAAIRTDLNFNELERHELKIKFNPDAIPSPEAMITHRMSFQEIAEGISEYAAITQIHEWMNEPGTISLGYNTLNFDDEFLRFCFYRNLLPPYTHQYANNCSRMDIYPITVMFYLYKNSILNWPKQDEKISLKLEALNKANQFVSKGSHNALADVEITIELAKRLAAERKMWDYICENFNKKIEQDRLHRLDENNVLMVLGKFGSERCFQSQVMCIGSHWHYKNQMLWLRLDDKDFTTATKETLLEMTSVVRKKSAEPGFLLPLEQRFMLHLDNVRLDLAKTNKRWLKENPQLFKFLADYHRDYKYPEFPATDADASLYINGFWSRQEEAFCNQFHAADPKQKAALLEKSSNSKLNTLAIRLLGRNFSEYLSPKLAEEFSKYLQQINPVEGLPAIIDFKGKSRLTPSLALQQIRELRDKNALDAEQMAIINDLEEYLQKRFLA